MIFFFFPKIYILNPLSPQNLQVEHTEFQKRWLIQFNVRVSQNEVPQDSPACIPMVLTVVGTTAW